MDISQGCFDEALLSKSAGYIDAPAKHSASSAGNN
jgi:hypothetical protein